MAAWILRVVLDKLTLHDGCFDFACTNHPIGTGHLAYSLRQKQQSITLEAEDPGRQPGGESLQPEAGPARPAGSLI
jgi:hypothetical protein